MRLIRDFFFGTNGWTAGQYTLFRVVLGCHLLHSTLLGVHGLAESGLRFSGLLALLGAVSATSFLLGYSHKVAPLVLAALWALVYGVIPYAPHHAQPLIVCILLAHIELPAEHLVPLFRTPRASPEWRLPQPVHALIWVIAILFFVGNGLAVVLGQSQYPFVTALFLLGPLALFERYRPAVWCALFATTVFLAAALGDVMTSLLLVLFFLFDPQWIPGRDPESVDTVYFDGECGLCHRFVLFALAEDRSGKAFVFAPLTGQTFQEAFSPETRTTLPDSIVVRTGDDRTLVKSEAALYIAKRLGGLWRLLASLCSAIPVRASNVVYDFVARQRKKVFAQPERTCPLVPEELSRRFLP